MASMVPEAARTEGKLQFEEAEEPAVFALDLHRDGVTPMATPPELDA